MKTKYFIKFKNADHRSAMMMNLPQQDIYFAKTRDDLIISSLDDEQVRKLQNSKAKLIPSTQYDLLSYESFDIVYSPLQHHEKNLTHVLSAIKAPQAWNISRGEGVHIAIIDTGICGNMSEFPAWKRSPYNYSYQGSAWTDIKGHGSMTACIASGNSKAGGRYDGVAPDANLITCKTSFDSTELYEIYEYLIGLVDTGEINRLVINNSYGRYLASPPQIDPDDPFIEIVKEAVKRGIVVIFAAGNNHVKVSGHDPLSCSPNTIWAANSLDQVISVGTVDEYNRMDLPPKIKNSFCHRDSSRGSGQLAQETTKPDCVAPTYGEVMWGCGYQAMEWWGTSGAAPQVAGLAALLLSKYPDLTPKQVHDLICQGCVNLPLAKECVGAGLINCVESLSLASQIN